MQLPVSLARRSVCPEELWCCLMISHLLGFGLPNNFVFVLFLLYFDFSYYHRYYYNHPCYHYLVIIVMVIIIHYHYCYY